MDFDLITIGDPTIDTFLKVHDAHLALKLRPRHTELCIDYADKIPVDELHRMPAGNCVNAAVAAARLGLRTAIYGVTGADSAGGAIRSDLELEGVDTSLLALDRRGSTNASTALVFRGERTLFVWHQPRRYHLPRLPATAWIYATSVGPPGPSVDRLHRDLCAQLDSSRCRLALSPGTHQLAMGAAALAPLLRRADLLFLNREEAAELTGLPSAEPRELLCALSRLGPRTSLVTDGRRGSYAFDGRRFYRTGILDAPVLDRTGAGDAYAASVTASVLLGLGLDVAMAWGTVQAAHVVGVFGATPGLLRRSRLRAQVRSHPDLVAREL